MLGWLHWGPEESLIDVAQKRGRSSSEGYRAVEVTGGHFHGITGSFILQTGGTDRRRVPAGKDTWQVSYLLQPHNDRSLLVPLADLWTSKRSGRGPQASWP